HRAAHVQPGGGPAARDQLRQETGQRDREEARGIRATHGRARLHVASGTPPRGMVHAGEEVELIASVMIEKSARACPAGWRSGLLDLNHIAPSNRLVSDRSRNSFRACCTLRRISRS